MTLFPTGYDNVIGLVGNNAFDFRLNSEIFGNISKNSI